METWPFQPLYTNSGNAGAAPAGTLVASVTVAASTSAAAGVLPGSNFSVKQIEITNQTNGWAFCNFGVQGVVTAATVAAGYPVAPGSDKVITIADEVTGVSVILASGATSGNVTFTRGSGA
jgi:hypothetical protein